MSKWLALALDRVKPAQFETEHVPASPASAPAIQAAVSAEVLVEKTAPYDGPFADDLAALLAGNPTDNGARWRQACMDADVFLRHWGVAAHESGWRSEELFGLHPEAPLARYDIMGLVWLIGGKTVVALDAEGALFSNGNRYRRMPLRRM